MPTSTQSAAEREDYDCPLCHELLFQPCVLFCGHPFCRGCLSKLLEHSSAQTGRVAAKCPVCRQVLHVTRAADLASCGQFDRLLETSFPIDYALRREAATSAGGADAQFEAATPAPQRLPLFVLDATLPRQHLQLNVFEPRYVDMVRRALAGNRCFGMVGFGEAHGMAKQGVEVVIESANEYFDGRFYVEVVGQRPFRILSSVEAEDGLIEGQVEFFDFESDGANDDGAAQAAAELLPLVQAWEEAVRAGCWERLNGHLALVREHLGPMPPSDQPGTLAGWVAALVNPLPALGVAPEIRPMILAARTPSERVQAAHYGVARSLRSLQTRQRSWVFKAMLLVPASVRPFVPAGLVLAIALMWIRGFSG